jgi:hypothetical protein
MSAMIARLARSKFLRSGLTGVVGFVAYGGWAYYVNLSFGAETALRAGLVQGAYSLALTMGSSYLIEQLLILYAKAGPRSTLLLASATSSAFALSVAYGIHWLIDTPMIFTTIMPGFVIGSAYALIYGLSVQKLQIVSIQ